MANNVIGLEAVIDVTKFNQGLQLYIKGMVQMTQATTQASAQINNLGVAASAGIGAALGAGAVSVINTFIGAINRLGASVIENSSSFESLGVSLNFFAARALQEQDKNLGLSEALAATRVEAQGLMLWVERLATLSPFTSEQVGNAFRTAQAYGLSLAAAQRLVPLLVDFASVNSLSAEVLQRIVLAVSQIQARGKLASQEINQLANAGVPIRDLLVKSLGVTRGELEKMLEDGLIPASAAIQTITGYLQGFEGAAENVTRHTLKGLISSLQDIVSISSRDIFGPMFASFFPILNQLIDIGNSTQFKAGVKVIGDALGEQLSIKIRLAISQIIILTQTIQALPPSVTQAAAIFLGFSAVLTGLYAVVGLLSVAIATLVNPFTIVTAIIAGFITAYATNFGKLKDITESTASFITNSFASIGRVISSVVSTAATAIGSATRAIGGFAETVIDYGASVVESFTAGILGALGLLNSAMRTIGGVLAFWLQPGSPPRVAPDLDTWGTDAVNEWLKGWLKGDFDILSDIGSSISDVLGALVSAGKLDELAAPRILQTLRSELAGAIDEFRRFGKVNESTFNSLAKAAGPAGDQVRALLKGYINLAIESDAAKKAQEALNAVTDRYNEILKPLRQQLASISELRQQADEQKEILSLQRLIANAGVGDARKQAAALRIQEILLGRRVRGIENQKESEESAADTALKAAEKRKDVAQEALDRTKAVIDAQNTQLNLYGQELQILEKIRKEQERLAKEARDKMLEQLHKQLKIAQLLQAELRDTIGVFKAQHTLADGTATAAEKAAAQLELQEVLGARIVRDFEAMELGIDPSTIQKIRDTLVTLEDIGIKSKPFEDFQDSIGGVQEDTNKLVQEMNEAMQDIRVMFKQTTADIDAFLEGINDMLPGFLKFRNAVKGDDKSLSDHLRTTREQTEAFNEWPPLFKTLTTAIAGIGAGLLTSRLLTLGVSLLRGLGGPIGAISFLVSGLAAAWAGDWFDIREHTADAIEFIQEKFDQFTSSDFFKNFSQNAQDALSTVQEKFYGLGAVISEQFNNVINPILQNGISLESITAAIETAKTLVLGIMDDLVSGLTQRQKDAASKIGTTISNFVTTYWNPFLASLLLNLNRTAELIKGVFGEISKSFGFFKEIGINAGKVLYEGVKLGFKPILFLAKSTFGLVGDIITGALGGIGRGIAKAIFAPIKVIGKLTDVNAVLTSIIESFQGGFAGGAVKGIFSTLSFLLDAISGTLRGIGNTLRFIGGISFKGFEVFARVAEKLFSLNADPLRATLFDILGNIGSKIGAGFARFTDITKSFDDDLKLIGEAFSKVGKIIFNEFIPALAEATGTGFVKVLKSVGSVLGGSFAKAFELLKDVGPIAGNVFKSLGSGLRDVATLGSIKVLEFFQGLSEGILRFAGAGEAKLGDALAGIFQGAFKGIGKGFAGVPQLIGGFFENLNLARLGESINGPKIFEGIFGIFKNFHPANILKGFKSIGSAVKGLIGTFGEFLGPIDLILAAIDFFAFAFNNDIEGVDNRARGFVDGLKKVFADLISGKLWQDIVSNFTTAWNIIVAVWQDVQKNGLSSPVLMNVLKSLGTQILTWVQETGTNIWISIQEFWLPIFGQWVVHTIENLGQTIGDILIFVRDFIVTAGGFLLQVISDAWSFFWTWWTQAGGQEKTLEWLQMVIDLVWGWITTSATFLYDNFVANWLPAFVNWLVLAWPDLLQGLLDFLGKIGQWIVEIAVPWLVEKLLDWATAFVTWLGPAAKFAIEGLGTLLATMIEWIIGTGIPLLIGGVVGMVQALVGWISGSEGDTAVKQVDPHLQAFLDALTTFFTVYIGPALKTAGIAIITALWNGIKEAWAKLMETEPAKAITDFLTKLGQQALNIYNTGLSIAKAIIDGIVNGFTTYVTEPYEAFKQWLLDLVGFGQEAIDAHSPSQLTKELIGQPIADGIVAGIQSITNNPIFKTVRNLAVKGLGALSEDGTEEMDGFSSGVTEIVNGLYAYIQTATNTFSTIFVATFTVFTGDIVTLLTELATNWRTAWDQIILYAETDIATMAQSIITTLGTFNMSLVTAMNAIRLTIVGAFTLANTDSATEVGKMAESILRVLVGTGEGQDTTSVAAQIRIAMEAAGKMIAQAFIQGMAFVFTDETSLTPLWTAVDSFVDALILRLKADMEIGSPSALAAREIGEPIAQGILMGMSKQITGMNGIISRNLSNIAANGSITQPTQSRQATFMPSNVTNISRNQEMNLYVTSNARSQGIIQDFAVMRTMMR